jgi:hypothetical protein
MALRSDRPQNWISCRCSNRSALIRPQSAVTLAPLGQIREIAADGSQSTVATLIPAGEGLGALGLALSPAC